MKPFGLARDEKNSDKTMILLPLLLRDRGAFRRSSCYISVNYNILILDQYNQESSIYRSFPHWLHLNIEDRCVLTGVAYL